MLSTPPRTAQALTPGVTPWAVRLGDHPQSTNQQQSASGSCYEGQSAGSSLADVVYVAPHCSGVTPWAVRLGDHPQSTNQQQSASGSCYEGPCGVARTCNICLCRVSVVLALRESLILSLLSLGAAVSPAGSPH
jgi:hypothetical protein